MFGAPTSFTEPIFHSDLSLASLLCWAVVALLSLQLSEAVGLELRQRKQVKGIVPLP